MKTRVLLITTSVVIMVVAFAVLRPTGDEQEDDLQTSIPSAPIGATGGANPARKLAAPEYVTVVVRNGKPKDGVKRIEADNGERVRILVKSDVQDSVHLHGYDIEKPVQAGGSAKFNFVADADGIYEIELEQRGVPIAELQVNP